MFTSLRTTQRAPAFVLLGAILLLPTTIVAAAPPVPEELYAAEYLAPFAVPAAINEVGAVVGWNPVYRTAFVYDDLFGYVELPCLEGAVCRAVDINDKGTIIGVAEKFVLFPRSFAVTWEPVAAGYELYALPAKFSGSRLNTEAVAIDNAGRILGTARTFDEPYVSEVYFLWTRGSGAKLLPLPGPGVDLNDSGQIAGNAGLPFVYDLGIGKVVWTELDDGWAGAQAHAISPAGTVAGSAVNTFGWQVGAVTDSLGIWRGVGGGGPEDYLFGINRQGDVAGHIHGLDPDSHCGLQFVESGEVATLESYSFPETRRWRVGEVAGITADRWLAAESVHDVSGLPGLIRLKPAKAPESCAPDCLVVEHLDVQLAPPEVAGRYSNLFVATVQLSALKALPSSTKVELTWVFGSGAKVLRATGEAGPDGRAVFTATWGLPSVEVYVTQLHASGYRFDPTAGMLHAKLPLGSR